MEKKGRKWSRSRSPTRKWPEYRKSSRSRSPTRKWPEYRKSYEEQLRRALEESRKDEENRQMHREQLRRALEESRKDEENRQEQQLRRALEESWKDEENRQMRKLYQEQQRLADNIRRAQNRETRLGTSTSTLRQLKEEARNWARRTSQEIAANRKLHDEHVNNKSSNDADAVRSARIAANDARAAMAAVDDCWQPQKGQLCGWHAVRVVLCVLKNNSISRDKFNKDMMPSKENQEGMGINSDTIRGILYKSDKGYTIDAITNVLTRNHLDVQHIFADLRPVSDSTRRSMTREQREHFDTNMKKLEIDEPRAIIVGNGKHWAALIKHGISWFNADSTNERTMSLMCMMSSPVLYFTLGIRGVIEYIKKVATKHATGILVIR